MKHLSKISLCLILFILSACGSSEDNELSSTCTYRKESESIKIEMTFIEKDIIRKKATAIVDYENLGLTKEEAEDKLITQGEDFIDKKGITFTNELNGTIYTEILDIDFEVATVADLEAMGYNVSNPDFFSLSRNIEEYENQGYTCK